MTTGRQKTRRHATKDIMSFADTVENVQKNVSPGDGFSGLEPGDLADHGSGTVLRHIDGAICRLAESGLDLDDARLCVRGGADVFVNPVGYPTPRDVTCWPVESEFWIRHEDAASLAGVAPEPIDNASPACFDLFKGPDGEVVVMATGAFRWGPELATFAADGTTMPAAGVLLHQPMPLGGEDDMAFHIVGHSAAGENDSAAIRWVGNVPRVRPRIRPQ